jgi:integrase
MVDPCARHDSNVRPLLPLGAGCRPRSLRDAAQSSSGISFSTTPGPSRRGAQSGASSIETPTLRSHCYGLLRTILGTAASHGKLAANPCNVKGAGNTKRVEKIRPASLPELEKITAEMPAQYAAMILLAAWCAMRFGELTELRRRDLVLDPDQGKGVIRIERAVVRTDGGSRPRRPRATPGLVMSPSRRT